MNLVNFAVSYAEKHNLPLEIAESYGEPGYTDPESEVIFFSNWNDWPEHIMNGLERRGYELEWDDEWVIDTSTNKAYRCEPDSYFWTPSYIQNDWTNGEIIGKESILEYPTDYIEEYLLNDPLVADRFGIPLENYGFSQYNEDPYENGFHPGQKDDPHKILKQAQESYPEHDFVFQLDAVEQFCIKFSLWMRPNDSET